MKQIFPSVFKKDKQILTKNLVPGFKSYGKLVTIQGKEYEIWDPKKSKAAAGIMNGLKNFPIKKGIKILYLGISSGSTSSFFSDIIEESGIIYGVEISERSIRDLNPVADKRGNIVPILANAKLPENYAWVEKVDVIYQDVATDDQSEILIRNCEKFLKPDGFAMLAIKSRSIDVIKDPKEVYKQEIKKLDKHFKILEKIILDPWEKDHMFLVMKWK
ncbi:MAG: fibrillarin-like rRNA/tRNA 2'-O-methyltransferase [Candidatus Aenigmatarchaeota archaeon]